MARILFFITSFSLAVGFRMNQAKKGALMSAQAPAAEAAEPAALAEEAANATTFVQKQYLSRAPRAFCSLSGDPHVLTFDTTMRGGGHWHPMHAVGHYWLVRSAQNLVNVQASYGQCGLKNGGGWMAARLNGIARTCMTGIAVGGKIMEGLKGPLVVQAPCEWDWDNSRCTNSDRAPRITWNGQRVNSVNHNGVLLVVNGNHVSIKLPQNMEIVLHFGGNWNGVPWTYMNARIFMVQGTAGNQCGHCGNYNGNPGDDMVYEMNGNLKAGADKTCEANVRCSERLIPSAGGCKPNGNGTTFTIEDCPEKLKTRAEQECREKFNEDVDPAVLGKLPGAVEEDELEDCIMDACLDEGFVDDDAADAAEEAKTVVKSHVRAGPKAFCSVSGDPHILTFDAQFKNGPRWHPMHAVGHYWLVKTKDNQVAIQAIYSECGLKNGGGWMAARLNGVPRTCMSAIAIGGKFLEGLTSSPLVIRAPCDWDWEHGTCRNNPQPNAGPIISWNGATVANVNTNGVTVSVQGSKVVARLPLGITVNLELNGHWTRSIAATMMNCQIEMPQGSAGPQCGHCGNFNGDKDDDMMYEETGELKDPGFTENNAPEHKRSYSSVWDNNPIGTGHAMSMLDSSLAWCSRHNAPGQWMTIALDAPTSVDGIYIQGRHAYDQSVTRVQFEQSADCQRYTPVDGGKEYDTGVRPMSEQKHLIKFSQPVTAQCIRVVVKAWRHHICMRAALSSATSLDAPVVENVAEARRTYSSVWGNNATGHGHARSVLDSAQGWSSAQNAVGQWMNMQLDEPSLVDGVYFQPRHDYDQSVTKVSFERSLDCRTYAAVDGGAAYDTNSQWPQKDAKQLVRFRRPVKARCIRVKVLGWRNHISMRAALSVQKGDSDLCEPAVGCRERLFDRGPKCKENGPGATFDFEDCPKDIRDKSEKICKQAFQEEVPWAVANKIPKSFYEEQLKDCIMDGCLNNAFADLDAVAAEEEDELELKLKR